MSQGKILSYLCSESCSTKYRESLNERIKSAKAKKQDGCSIDSTGDQLPKSVIDITQSPKGDSSTNKQVASDSSVTVGSTALINLETPDSVSTKRPQVRRFDESGEFIRSCSECGAKVIEDDRTLSWETMDFCNEICLGLYAS